MIYFTIIFTTEVSCFFYKKERQIEDKRRSLEKFHVFEASLPAFLTALKKQQGQF